MQSGGLRAGSWNAICASSVASTGLVYQSHQPLWDETFRAAAAVAGAGGADRGGWGLGVAEARVEDHVHTGEEVWVEHSGELSLEVGLDGGESADDGSAI